MVQEKIRERLYMKDYVIIYKRPARHSGLYRTSQMTLEEAHERLVSEGYEGLSNDPERAFRKGEREAHVLKTKNF